MGTYYKKLQQLAEELNEVLDLEPGIKAVGLKEADLVTVLHEAAKFLTPDHMSGKLSKMLEILSPAKPENSIKGIPGGPYPSIRYHATKGPAVVKNEEDDAEATKNGFVKKLDDKSRFNTIVHEEDAR